MLQVSESSQTALRLKAVQVSVSLTKLGTGGQPSGIRNLTRPIFRDDGILSQRIRSIFLA
jgi:hypothetical protein